MVGERLTNKALKPAWQTHQELTDGIQPPRRGRAVIISVGGAADSAIAQLARQGTSSAQTVAIDEDPLRLRKSEASIKILVSREFAKEMYQSAGLPTQQVTAREAMQQIEATLEASNIVFINASSDDRAGLSTASIVAGAARAKGAITVSVVTQDSRPSEAHQPSTFSRLNELRSKCNTVIVIDQSRLTELEREYSRNTEDGMGQVLAHIIKGLVETSSKPGLNNGRTEFSNAMRYGGFAAVAMGEGGVSKRVKDIALEALDHPLLDISRIEARNLVVHVTAGGLMSADEAHIVGDAIAEALNGRTRISWEGSVDSELEGVVRVVLLMTGLETQSTLGGLSSTALQLYNLEPRSKPEKELPVDLGLYQLESFKSQT